jgi:hypothetical protein
MAAHRYLLKYDMLDSEIRAQLLDLSDEIETEHEYESLQDDLRHWAFLSALRRIARSPTIVSMVARRAPRAIGLAFQRRFRPRRNLGELSVPSDPGPTNQRVSPDKGT